MVGPKGELCVSAFNDLNGDGFRDAGEPLVAGIRIALRPSVGDTWYVVTRDSASVCSTVPARIWRVAAVPSDIWGAVDEDEVAVLLTDGARIDVGVGMRAEFSPSDLYVPLAIYSGR